MELGLPRKDDDWLMHAIVKRRKMDDEGKAVVNMNNNPLIDNRTYEVQFSDSTTEVLTDSIIANNILAQVDKEGNRQMFLDQIIDHRQDVNDIGQEDAFRETKNRMKQRKMTETYWQLCIQWKDGSTYWVALKDIKKSYPVELADCANMMKIDDKPAFAWWVPYVQNKREIILSKVKSKYWKRTLKYGIWLPYSVK